MFLLCVSSLYKSLHSVILRIIRNVDTLGSVINIKTGGVFSSEEQYSLQLGKVSANEYMEHNHMLYSINIMILYDINIHSNCYVKDVSIRFNV